MKKNVFSLVLTFLVITLAGCYPDGPEYVDEYDIVYTNHDATFAFGGKGTYSMPDSVVKITGDAVAGDPLVFVSPGYANTILKRIEDNMKNHGYTRVSNQALAELVLFPSAVEVTNISYYYDYWGYYYGWYYPPYYGGWYYPYPVTTSYTTGSLFMTLTDNVNTSPTDKHKVAWIGIANGLLEGASYDFDTRIEKAIDQAFAQSEYLHP